MAILINDNSARVQYAATSGQTVFTVPFEFFANADLKVYQNSTLKTITTHYTVTGAGVTGGGTVTFVTGATLNDVITIVRDVAVARVTDFPSSGPFIIEDLNTDLDRLIAMVQQQETKLTRTVRLDDFDTPNSFQVLPSKVSRAGKIMAFDSNGNVTVGEDIGNWRGNWAAGVAYTVRDLVKDSSNSNVYRVNTAHTSSGTTPISSNADIAKFDLVVDAAAAAASAAAAAASASAAATSASNASTSASNASTFASNSSTSASAASTSASNASSAQTAAESARDATLAAYDTFDDRYLGSKTSDPTLDNDGNALVGGALYFNSVAGEMRIWTGSAWVAAYVSGTGFVAKSGDTMTGVLGLTAGTVSLPAITTTGDTNTGIFFPAADTIAFTEGGAEAMRINSSGQVEFRAGTAALPAISTTGDINTGVFYPAADTVGIATGGTEMVRVASAGQIGIAGANYGTSGQVLTSGGAAAAPSWATPASSGQLIRAPQVLTSGTSYTTPAGCTAILVEMWGGGGGGGSGAEGSTGDTASPGTGGGGGAYLRQYIAVSPSTAYTIAIGAAGSGGAAVTSSAGNNGTAGGTTLIIVSGTTYSCTGGGAGSGGKLSGTGATVTQSAAATGGTATGVSGLAINGGDAEKYVLNFGPSSSPANGWGGGSSFAGPAGYPGVLNGNAVPTTVTTPGTGGGGGGSGLQTTVTAGGAGGAGRMVISEYT